MKDFVGSVNKFMLSQKTKCFPAKLEIENAAMYYYCMVGKF